MLIKRYNIKQSRSNLQDLNELFETVFLHFCDHGLHHLLPDGSGLGLLGVAGCLDLSSPPLSEANAEKSEKIAVGSLDLDEGLDQRLPFLDKLTDFVSGSGHTVETGVAVLRLLLNFLDLELDVSVVHLWGLVQIGKVNCEDTSFKILSVVS